MKRIHRILSVLVCIALLIPTLATTVFAAVPAGNSRAAVPNAPAELDALSSYLHASESTEDNTSHLPVNVHTYYDVDKEYTPATIGEGGSVSILYVMNTNTERLGTKSDAELVQSFLDRGYFVIVLDYMNNPAATGTALDWSTQDMRCQVIGGAPFSGGRAYTSGTYTDGKLAGTNPICAQSYILPAGYDIAYNIPYFSYDKYGTAGTFELIVEIWNNDFKSVKRGTIVKWVDENGLPRLDLTDAITEKAATDNSNIDYATWFKSADGSGAISQANLEKLSKEEQKAYQYTYIGNTIVREVTDCVQPDGTMIDLNLYMDIIYPADYYDELPVMITMSSGYTRANSWSAETRPYLNGPLFNGYVGVVSDYGLVPMCRNDHYGYFCGDSQLNSVSGDNGTYSLSYYNGIRSDTALLRTLRKIGVEGLDVEGYGFVTAPINPEKIGAYGNSKGGVIVRLANPTPEKLQELRCFEGHNGETRLEAFEKNYPYVDPYLDENGNTTDSRIAAPEEQPILTYSNGQTIHSGLNFVFANCGGASNTLVEESAPIFGVGTQSGKAEGSYYTYYATTANLARNLDIPFFGLVAPTIAHDLGYGLDKDYGLDILESFNRYANYWLKDDSVECIIVDVDTTQDICVAADVAIDNVYEINENSSIKLQFTGSVSAYEIEKVKIISLTTGEELAGDWHGSYGNQQWQFIPYDIKDATYYTVVVPADLCAENGKSIKEPVTHTFRTASGVTDSAVSVTLPTTAIAEYDCVNRGFSVAAAGYTIDQSTYKFNAFKGTGNGLMIDLRAIGAASNVNSNQNVRLPVFDEIWSDSKHIGKTIVFSFDAKASEAGSIKLALNQHGNGNYVWGDGWGLISSETKLTTEWQTYTYSFTVTEEMFAAKSVSTSATPEIALGVRFTGFLDDNGKYKGAQINFANFKTYYTGDATDRTLSDVNDSLIFNFEEKDYSTAHNVTLRFAVENDAINTVGIYKVNNNTIGDKLGEVVVTGAGIYNFDVTDYLKSCVGAPSVAVKIEKAVGSSTIKDFDYEASNTGIGFNALAKYVITDEAPNADGSSNTSAKVEYGIRSAYYIDLDGNLVSKYTGSLYQFAASTNGFKGGAFNESDFGKRYRVTFRVYDETSRVINVFNGDGYHFDYEIADFGGSNCSFYTTAGEWTTVTVEFTVDNEIYLNEAIRSHIFFFYAENKSVAALDADVAVNVRNMAAATVKPGNYAGKPGLNDSYTIYGSANAVAEAGKVTYYEDLSYGLYIDDIVFEEVTTDVNLASTAPMLSITPTTTEDILPTVATSVLSTQPDTVQNGLWISGGKDGFDTNSVKSYVKLSLDGYYGGFSAFVFNAKSEGNANVSLYAVADINAGQNWTAETITSANAPANDIYGSGVNLNAVYGNKSLATFAVGTSSQNCVVELTEFTDYMLANGANEVTLIIVSDTKNVTTIEIPGGEIVTKVDDYDCINKGPSTTAAGYTLDQSTYKFYSWIKGEDGGLQIDTRAISGAVNANQNAQINVFDTIWSDISYVGKTIRFSFRAKASEAGAITVALNKRQLYAFTKYPGLNGTADLTTEWQTFTFEFVVTEEMYNIIDNTASGIDSPGLALGVRFTDFSNGSKYYDTANGLNGAQIVLRDFVINAVELPEETDLYHMSYDFSTTKPTVDTRGYGAQIATITDGELVIDLAKDTQAPNANGYTRVTALDHLFSDSSNAGKTFVISFRAKATEAGIMDFAFNKFGSFNTYSYAGKSYNGQYALTTEYQTFRYTFTAVEDMFTTHASTNLNLAFRLYNGYLNGSAYKAAQVYIDDITITENPYIRSVDTTYDFSTAKPTFDTRGYGAQLAKVINDELVIDLTKDTQAPNANGYTRVEALNEILTNSSSVDKTFAISFRAKASEAGLMDFAFNKFGSFNTYSYGGKTYKTQYSLTTEYQTFTYTFTVTSDMISTHATTALNLAYRFYNGYVVNGAHKAAQIYIDDLRIYEDLVVKAPTIDVTDAQAVSGSGNSDILTVYADDSAAGAPKIMKTYLAYNLAGVTSSYGASLNVNLTGAKGENVKVYVLGDTIISSNLTYGNAPIPTGAPAASFVAVNGMNAVDISDAIAENAGKNIVIILAIEEPSDEIQITATPELEVSREYHNYTSDSQRHPAVAPTYNTVGNIEFYSCEGCEKLYVKNGDEFVEVTVDDVIIPVLVCDEHNYVNAICTICGRKEAHKCTGGIATCSQKAVCEICGQEYGSLNLNAHAWNEGVITKNPTCTENGIKTFTCQNDSTHTYTEEIIAIGHKYEGVVTSPDCENGGYTTYTCTVCGDSYVADQVGPLGHTNATPVVENNVNPDCEKDGGYDIVVYCSVCGDEVSRVHTVAPALGHNYNSVVTAPDCENGGYTTYTCTVCGDSYIADATEAIGHKYNAVVTEPDCENGGYTTYTCLVCGDSYTDDEVGALGHDEEIIPGKKETCTEAGLTDGVKCSTCGKILNEQIDIPASGHIDVDRDYMCDVCDEDLCTNHEEEIILGKDATCTTTGLTEGKKCAICGEILVAQDVIAALGHSYNAAVTAPDCENSGYTTYTCTVCGDSYIGDEVAAIGHTNGAPVVENNVNPDCVNSGSYDTVIYCTVCGDEVSRVNTFVPALGHTNGTPVVENNVNPDCVNGGGYDVVIYCTICSAEVSRVHTTVAALGHNYNAVVTSPDCENGGYTTYTCTVCGDSYIGDETAALGHNYNAVVTAPDCENGGYTTYTCSVCGDSYIGDEVAALGHNWEEATTEAPKTCKVCGETQGEKLPETDDVTPDTEPSEEKNHDECKASNSWKEFLTRLINFFRQLFGLPPKCYCGEEL